MSGKPRCDCEPDTDPAGPRAWDCPANPNRVGAVSVPVADTTEIPHKAGGCPDGGACHHWCADGPCFRVETCGPLSGVFPDDQWPSPAVPVPADRLAQIAADDQPFDPFDAIQLRVRLGEVEAELAAAHRERDEATRSLAAQLAAERILHRRTTRERDAARADWDRQWEASRDFQADALDAQRERDAALAQLAKVRELAEKRLRPSSPIRERILAAAGGNPGSTP
jgi:hypothetical protein